jgi:hypothetical protein
VERLSGLTVPPLSGQAGVESDADVSAGKEGRNPVERKGAERGVTVWLGRAVAMRARLAGRLAMAQDVSNRHHPTRNSPRAENRTECSFNGMIESNGGEFRISVNPAV